MRNMGAVYIRVPVETQIGDGMAYYEVDSQSGYALRQVDVINGRCYSSRELYHPGIGIGLADQPFTADDLSQAEKVRPDEFEALWAASG